MLTFIKCPHYPHSPPSQNMPEVRQWLLMFKLHQAFLLWHYKKEFPTQRYLFTEVKCCGLGRGVIYFPPPIWTFFIIVENLVFSNHKPNYPSDSLPKFVYKHWTVRLHTSMIKCWPIQTSNDQLGSCLNAYKTALYQVRSVSS